MMATRTIIYLFRNDLRLHDNECLNWAMKNADHVIPLYCFDPDHYRGTYHYNFPKTNNHRAKFLIQTVEDLRKSLRNKGTNLIVRHEKPSSAIKSLIEQCKKAPVKGLVFQKEVTKEETVVEDDLKQICSISEVKMTIFWGSTLYHKDDLPFSCRDIPDTYTAFRKSVEGRCEIRPLINDLSEYKPLPSVENGKLGDIPTLEQLGVVDENDRSQAKSAFPFSGGETTGVSRLNDYLWQTDHVSTYKKTRNGLVGTEYSTKFSAWLANGSLSPRMIYHRVKEYEEQRVANDSTYWVIFELIWRDYFKYVCWKYGDAVFYPGGIQNKHIEWKKDMNLFKKWQFGQTGVPFVDANMRELLHTGWMSNRGRQNVASFLVKDLHLDWRLGAEWFESMLLDHDVCSNYGNWNYSAGIGNDPRENRKFNMIKQGLDYDPNGDFIRMWLPELSKVSNDKIHFPWTSPQSDALDYPKPTTVAPEWARHFSRGASGGGKRGQPTQKQRGIDFYFKSPSGSKGKR